MKGDNKRPYLYGSLDFWWVSFNVSWFVSFFFLRVTCASSSKKFFRRDCGDNWFKLIPSSYNGRVVAWLSLFAVMCSLVHVFSMSLILYSVVLMFYFTCITVRASLKRHLLLPVSPGLSYLVVDLCSTAWSLSFHLVFIYTYVILFLPCMGVYISLMFHLYGVRLPIFVALCLDCAFAL